MRALLRLPARRGLGRRAGLLAQRRRVVVRGPVPQHGGGRRRRQGERVLRRRDRTVPAQPVPVRAAAPAGGTAGQAAQPGQQVPHRRGQPGRRRCQPGRGTQQVDGEVGGERDGRLQLGVHRRDGDRSRPDHGGLGRGGHGPGGHGRDGDRRGGRGAEPVHPQRRRPPGQVRAVRAGAPGGPPGDQPPTARGPRRGGHRCRADRGAARLDAQHTDRQPERQAPGEVTGDGRGGSGCGGGVRAGRVRRSGAEQPEAVGRPGGGHVGAPDLGGLDRHVLPSR